MSKTAKALAYYEARSNGMNTSEAREYSNERSIEIDSEWDQFGEQQSAEAEQAERDGLVTEGFETGYYNPFFNF